MARAIPCAPELATTTSQPATVSRLNAATSRMSSSSSMIRIRWDMKERPRVFCEQQVHRPQCSHGYSGTFLRLCRWARRRTRAAGNLFSNRRVVFKFRQRLWSGAGRWRGPVGRDRLLPGSIGAGHAPAFLRLIVFHGRSFSQIWLVGQEDAEGGASYWITLGPDPPGVLQHNCAADGEAKAASAFLARI